MQQHFLKLEMMFHLPAHSERVMDWICSVFWVFNRLWRVLTIPVDERTPCCKPDRATRLHRGLLMMIYFGGKHRPYRSFHSACGAPFYPAVCAHSGLCCSTLPRLPWSASCRQRHKNPAQAARHLCQAEQHFSSMGRTWLQLRAACTDSATSITGYVSR